ncbi:hypothetical protein ABPG72_009079 [Tetrahymena utriculariae]
MSQYFSNIPRDFPHQRKGKQIPQEIKGTVKRLDQQQNTEGNWDKLIQRTQEFQVCSDPNKQTQYRQRMIDEIKRGQSNIFPDQNTENEVVHFQKRVFPEQMANQNNTGGIINQLTRLDSDQYQPSRQIHNIQQRQSCHDDYLKMCQKQVIFKDSLKKTRNYYLRQNQILIFCLKYHKILLNRKNYFPQSDLNYYSQIKTLPGQAYRDGDEQKLLGPAEERNRGIAALQQKSQITNLPGSTYGKVERQPEKILNPDSYKVRLQETTPEMYNNSNLTEYYFQKIQPHSVENALHCQEEYDIIPDKGFPKKFPDKKDNLYRTTYTNEQIKADTITGCRKKKAFNDPFHTHFQLG